MTIRTVGLSIIVTIILLGNVLLLEKQTQAPGLMLHQEIMHD